MLTCYLLIKQNNCDPIITVFISPWIFYQPLMYCWTEKTEISSNLNFPFFLKKKKKVSFVSAPTFHLSNNWYLLNHKHTFHHLKSPQVSLYSLLLHRWRAAQQAFVKPILWSTIVLMSWTFLLTWPHEREWYAFHSFICTYLEPMWDKEMRNYASKF